MENSNQPDRIWGSASATINLGNYENIKIEVGYSRDLHPDEDADVERDLLLGDVVNEIIRRAEAIKKGFEDEQ